MGTKLDKSFIIVFCPAYSYDFAVASADLAFAMLALNIEFSVV